ncbi:MAG: hypothetical protein WBC73_20735 [Phormidesmis sp.]
MTVETDNWYIVKRAAGPCEGCSEQALSALDSQDMEKWGPFKTKNQAIAKRVGLIRAGKCQPQ